MLKEQNEKNDNEYIVLLDFLLTVKAAPHECIIRTGQLYTWAKTQNEA